MYVSEDVAVNKNKCKLSILQYAVNFKEYKPFKDAVKYFGFCVINTLDYCDNDFCVTNLILPLRVILPHTSPQWVLSFVC